MNLSIIDTQSGEPLVILSEDDRGMKVVGGDPRMVERLGINKMRDLKEVADYINSPGSNLQALFDDPGETGETQLPESQQPDQGIEPDRIKPALEIIKELTMRVQRRKEQQEASRQQTSNEAEALNTTDSQVVMDRPETIYVSIDGDNIGNAVARAEEKDDEAELAALSNRINSGQEVLQRWAAGMGGTVIEAGGDEGLVKVPGSAMDHVEELRSQYNRAVGATATVGVGRKISESTKARMLGKLKGKNQTVIFDDSTEKELQLRLEQQDQSESNKVRTALSEPNEPGAPKRVQNMGEEAAKGSDEGQPEQESGQEPAQGSDEPGDDSDQGPQGSAGAPARQQEAEDDQQASQEDEPEEEQAPVKKSLSPGLTGSLGRQEPPPSGNSQFDPNIESEDFSDRDDPEFAKRLWYAFKYGDR